MARKSIGVIALTGSLLLAGSPSVASDLSFDTVFGPAELVAEFRGDLQPTDLRDSQFRFGRDPLADNVGTTGVTERGRSGAEALPVASFMHAMDRRFRESLATGSGSYRAAHDITIGPRISTGESSETLMYLRRGEEFEVDADLGVVNVDDGLVRSGVGIEQVWLWGEDGASIHLGYEFGEDQLGFVGRDRVTGHTLRLGSQIPLRWGLSARVEAGYTRHLYSDLNGGGLHGDRMEFSAGLAGSVTDRLSGSFGYLYSDDTLQSSPLFPSRHVWGLNLQFLY